MEFFTSLLQLSRPRCRFTLVYRAQQLFSHFNANYHLSTIIGCCTLCLNKSKNGSPLCDTCASDIAKFTLPKHLDNLLHWPMFNSLFQTRYFDQLLCQSPYVWPTSMWLKQFKYQGRFEFSVLFAQQLSGQWQQYLAKQNIDSSKHNHVVTCVPIHIRRWQQRGFNQAHLIAKRFARYCHLDYFPHMLERIHHRDAQVGQTGAARRRNLLHAFKVNDSNVLEGKHIILIDDVITTGATVNEISKQLKRLGVESITVLTVAIALPMN